LERKRKGRTRRTAARKRTGGGMRTRRIRQPPSLGGALLAAALDQGRQLSQRLQRW
jgi:hypothetical protein